VAPAHSVQRNSRADYFIGNAPRRLKQLRDCTPGKSDHWHRREYSAASSPWTSDMKALSRKLVFVFCSLSVFAFAACAQANSGRTLANEL
jgi:hypothetical protein